MKKKIGLVGFGLIGKYLFEKVLTDNSVEVDFVFDADFSKTDGLDPSLVLKSIEELRTRSVDLVVEAAHPEAVKEWGPHVLEHADLLVFSLTAFADEDFFRRMEEQAKKKCRDVHFSHGAVLALDGIHDGRMVMEAVEICTTKHPRNLGLNEDKIDASTIVYQGTTREACRLFPRNVNVHAAVALAGLGFDRTVSTIVADPQTDMMTHVVEVRGAGLRWKIEIESRSAGEVTGQYTPESVFRTVQRICAAKGGFRLA